MNILHLESSPNWGGQEMRILEEIRWLIDHGHGAWIGARAGSKIIEEAKKRNVPFLEINLRANFNPISTFKLLAFIKKDQIDIVNTHSSKDAWHGMWLRCFGIPVVRTRHVVQQIKPGFFHRLSWRAGCNHVIATAEAIRRQLLQADCLPQSSAGESQISVVGEGIDMNLFKPREPLAGLRTEWNAKTHRTAGLIGMFRSDKGHRFFVEAAIRLAGRYPDSRFILVGGDMGSGQLRRELQQKVKNAGLEKQILFYGYRADVPDFIASLDVIVVASTGTEAQSRMVPQAFAMKRPVVATRVGGLPELVIDGQTGLLIDPGNSEAMADAIEKTWEQPEATRQRVDKAYQFSLDQLDFNKKMNETLEVYSKIIRKRTTVSNP